MVKFYFSSKSKSASLKKATSFHLLALRKELTTRSQWKPEALSLRHTSFSHGSEIFKNEKKILYVLSPSENDQYIFCTPRENFLFPFQSCFQETIINLTVLPSLKIFELQSSEHFHCCRQIISDLQLQNKCICFTCNFLTLVIKISMETLF